MSAEQDETWFELADGVLEKVTRYNTELYRYIGKSAFGEMSVFNHIRLVTEFDEDGDPAEAHLIFHQPSEDGEPSVYENLSRFMLRHNYPQHFNLARVTPLVRYAFDMAFGISHEEGLTFPQEWTGDPEVDLPPDPNFYDLGEEDFDGKGVE